MANVTPTLSPTLLTEIIATNEVGSLDNAYVLSNAGVANSGYSVGAFQLDLAHQPGARQTVENFLDDCGAFSADDLSIIEQALLISGNANAIPQGLQAAINTEFATAAGKAMIDGLDAGQLNMLMAYIAQALGNAQASARYAADMAFRSFSDSVLFQALMGDNTNQFGPPNTFGRYIQGQAVTVGGDSLQLGDGPWNFQAFAAYEAHYSYVTTSEQGASDLRRRRTNVVDILGANGLLGGETQAACLTIIQDTYQAVA